MATWNKRKLAALIKENREEHPRSNLAQNSNVPRWQEDYIFQVSQEIEERVSKKLSKKFSRTENRTLSALAGLDFLINPLIQGHSGTTPEMSRNEFSTNQGTNEDDSQSDLHPGAGIFGNRTMRNSGQENQHDMVTGVHEEVTYCSPSTSSGKQKEKRSTSHLQIRSENTPATIEADHFLLAHQQLANNNNSANFHNNFNRISKLPKSHTTTMPTLDGKSQKFELFENLLQTSLKIHIQLTEEDRINYIHSLMRGDALQTFKNINSSTRENLGEILAVFWKKNVKPQSMATAKHKFQKLVFNPAIHKLVDFLDELRKLAKNAFGIAAHAIIEQFIYAKMPPHLKKSINQAHLENGTYEQSVTHLERELELNSFEYPVESQMNTVTHKQQIEGHPDNAGNINSNTNDSNPNNHKIDRKQT